MGKKGKVKGMGAETPENSILAEWRGCA